jgi:hypothetical protein
MPAKTLRERYREALAFAEEALGARGLTTGRRRREDEAVIPIAELPRHEQDRLGYAVLAVEAGTMPMETLQLLCAEVLVAHERGKLALGRQRAYLGSRKWG